jgi:hypothetical protein
MYSLLSLFFVWVLLWEALPEGVFSISMFSGVTSPLCMKLGACSVEEGDFTMFLGICRHFSICRYVGCVTPLVC